VIYVGPVPAGATQNRGTGKPRLLVVTPDFPPARGGIQALMGGLVEDLKGFDVTVVALDSRGARDYDAGLDCRVRRVAAPARLAGARNIPLNAVVLREARRASPAVCLAGHIVTSPATAAIARLARVPTVQYFHANEIGDKPRLAAFAARTAAASVVVSTYTAGLLARVEPEPGDVRLIPPGIDLPAPAPSEGSTSSTVGPAGSRSTGPPTLVTVSRLAAPYKGHDVLLRALPAVRAQVPDVRWVVIGDGPLRSELESGAQAARLGEGVRFLGAVSDAERDSWLARADVFAMPSRLPGGGLAGEGFGIAYMEAAAHGTPALAGNVGGAVDAVLDGETGLLVDPNDARAVAEALVRLLTDRELARRLGASAAARAQGYAWPVIAGRVEALLMELVQRGRS
jgi:phosphatidylinositol alpha-1,6-mannosyltransferase